MFGLTGVGLTVKSPVHPRPQPAPAPEPTDTPPPQKSLEAHKSIDNILERIVMAIGSEPRPELEAPEPTLKTSEGGEGPKAARAHSAEERPRCRA